MGTRDVKELLAEIIEVPELKVLTLPTFDKSRSPILGAQEHLDGIIRRIRSRGTDFSPRLSWAKKLICKLREIGESKHRKDFIFGAESLASFINVPIDTTLIKEEKCDVFMVPVGAPAVLLTVFRHNEISKKGAEEYNGLLTRGLSKAIKTYINVPFGFANGVLYEKDIYSKDFDKEMHQLIKRSSVLLNPRSLRMTNTKQKLVVNAFISSMVVTKPIVVDGEDVLNVDKYLLAMPPDMFFQLMDVILAKQRIIKCASILHADFIRIELARRLNHLVPTVLFCESQVVCEKLRKLEICSGVKLVGEMESEENTKYFILPFVGEAIKTEEERSNVICCVNRELPDASNEERNRISRSFDSLDSDFFSDSESLCSTTGSNHGSPSPMLRKPMVCSDSKYVDRGNEFNKKHEKGSRSQPGNDAFCSRKDEPTMASHKAKRSVSPDRPLNHGRSKATEDVYTTFQPPRMDRSTDDRTRLSGWRENPIKSKTSQTVAVSKSGMKNSIWNKMKPFEPCLPDTSESKVALSVGTVRSKNLCKFCRMKNVADIKEITKVMQKVFPDASASFHLINDCKSVFLKWRYFMERIRESKAEFLLKNMMSEHFSNVPLPLDETGNLILICTCCQLN